MSAVEEIKEVLADTKPIPPQKAEKELAEAKTEDLISGTDRKKGKPTEER